MIVTCWSAKGGSGVTTVAAALACIVAAGGGAVTLVDLVGDLPAVLGRPEPTGPGVVDLLADPRGLAPALRLAAQVDEHGIGLVGRGCGAWPKEAGERLGEGLARLPGTVVVDAGLVRPGSQEAEAPALAIASASTQSLLVMRSCYLGLRRAVAVPIRPSGIVLVREPGRSLGRADIEAALGIGVTAVVPWDPSVSRAVDAGLFVSRLPDVIFKALRRAA